MCVITACFMALVSPGSLPRKGRRWRTDRHSSSCDGSSSWNVSSMAMWNGSVRQVSLYVIMLRHNLNETGANFYLPYFSDHKMRRTIRRTMIFLLDILEKNNDECILILVIYWKKTGLVHTKISNHNIIYSS